MTNSKIVLENADFEFERSHYSDALSRYNEAETLGCEFSDAQIYKYAKVLSVHGEHNKTNLLLGQIPQYVSSSFDAQRLLYHTKKTLNCSDEELIIILEDFVQYSYDEEMMYELAMLYAKQNNTAKCRRICKKIVNTFRSGLFVDKANSLLETGCVIPVPFVNETASVTETVISPIIEEDKIELSKKNNLLPDFLEEAFSEMIGMDSVKRELKKFYDFALIEKLRAEKLGIPANSERGYNFILYGNPGTGKTTVARIIAKALYMLGIRENEKFVEVDRGKLVSENVGGTAPMTLAAIDSARGGTLFIDEAYSLYSKSSVDFGQEAIDTLLKDMEDNRNSYSVIMAGYRNQMNEMLDNTNPGFRSRFNFHIDIPDYTDDELIKIAHKIAEKHYYKIDDDGDDAIKKAISKGRIDETFGNARFIRELIEKAELNLSSRLQEKSEISEEDLVVLKAEDIFETSNDSESLNDLIEKLNSLTGLDDAKKRVQEIIGVINEQIDAERRGLKLKKTETTMHMTFKGNAGTGKTTVARLIGKIFCELGVLKRGDVFVECKRQDLVGTYQGHTAEKTKNVIRSALGGVLFIDEAYSLKHGDGDAFGQEAIDTLVAEMENHRDSLVVILAGYSSDIDNFLSSNQGLRSRVAYDLFFEDYTLDEMVDIFYSMARSEELDLSEDLRPIVKDMLEKNSQISGFGNARGVRNLFEKVKVKKALRPKVNDEDFSSIYKEDLEDINFKVGKK